MPTTVSKYNRTVIGTNLFMLLPAGAYPPPLVWAFPSANFDRSLLCSLTINCRSSFANLPRTVVSCKQQQEIVSNYWTCVIVYNNIKKIETYNCRCLSSEKIQLISTQSSLQLRLIRINRNLNKAEMHCGSTFVLWQQTGYANCHLRRSFCGKSSENYNLSCTRLLLTLTVLQKTLIF